MATRSDLEEASPSGKVSKSTDPTLENRIESSSVQPAGDDERLSIDPAPFSESRGNAQGSSAPEDRHARISDAAYRKAEARGFAPGAELDDWLAAEREVEDAHRA